MFLPIKHYVHLPNLAVTNFFSPTKSSTPHNHYWFLFFVFLALINVSLLHWQLLPIPPLQHIQSRSIRHRLHFIVMFLFYDNDGWTRWAGDDQKQGEKQLISSNRMNAIVKLVNCFPSVSCFQASVTGTRSSQHSAHIIPLHAMTPHPLKLWECTSWRKPFPGA